MDNIKESHMTRITTLAAHIRNATFEREPFDDDRWPPLWRAVFFAIASLLAWGAIFAGIGLGFWAIWS
jgi:hypothetical protein